jgi:hypothetical protein
MQLSDKLLAQETLTLEWKALIPITLEACGTPSDGQSL